MQAYWDGGSEKRDISYEKQPNYSWRLGALTSQEAIVHGWENSETVLVRVAVVDLEQDRK